MPKQQFYLVATVFENSYKFYDTFPKRPAHIPWFNLVDHSKGLGAVSHLKVLTYNTLLFPSWSMPKNSFDTVSRRGVGRICNLWLSHRSSCRTIGKNASRLRLCYAEPESCTEDAQATHICAFEWWKVTCLCVHISYR